MEQLEDLFFATLSGQEFTPGQTTRFQMERLTIEFEFVSSNSFYFRVLDGETVKENRLVSIATCDLPLETDPT